MFKDKLELLLKQRSMRYSELAKVLGVSRSAVSKWISGEAIPRNDVLQKMSKMLSVTVGYLIDDESDSYEVKPPPALRSETYSEVMPSFIFCEDEPDYLDGFVWVPVYETKISATPGIQDIIRNDIVGWHTAPKSFATDDPLTRPFSMKVVGDSMSPMIMPGDYLTIKPMPFIIPDPKGLYAVKINDDLTDIYGIVVKRVQVDEHRGIYLLRSDNRNYPVYIVENEKAAIIGRIINIWRTV